MVFLEEALLISNFDKSAFVSGALGSGIAALIATFFLFFVLLMLGLYIYLSFAYMAIARKAKYSSPGIAWIPFVGPLIITNQISKMHWWPWLLFIGFAIPVIGFIAAIVFEVFSIIWLWKTFDKIKVPNWWAILTLIPVVGLVFIGIAAWSKK